MQPNNQPTLSEGLNQDIQALTHISEQLNFVLNTYRTMRMRLLNLEREASIPGVRQPISEEAHKKLREAQNSIDGAFQPIGMTASRALEMIDQAILQLNDVFTELRRIEDSGH